MKYTEHYDVTSHNVDINDNIRPSDLLMYLQETGNHQMRDRSPSMNDLLTSGKTFIVTRMSIEIYEQLHQYDKVDVKTWNCPGKPMTFRRCYEIVKDGKVAVRAYGEFAAVEIESRKFLSADEVDLSNYEADEVYDLEIPKKFRYAKDLEFVKVAEKEMTYSNIDMNGHVNNTFYPNFFWERIPNVEDKKITSINMRFMHEARCGDIIDIYMTDYPTETAKDSRAEEAYAFYSTVNGEKNYEVVFGTAKAEKPNWEVPF